MSTFLLTGLIKVLYFLPKLLAFDGRKMTWLKHHLSGLKEERNRG